MFTGEAVFAGTKLGSGSFKLNQCGVGYSERLLMTPAGVEHGRLLVRVPHAPDFSGVPEKPGGFLDRSVTHRANERGQRVPVLFVYIRAAEKELFSHHTESKSPRA
jgi:hypothetical protein